MGWSWGCFCSNWRYKQLEVRLMILVSLVITQYIYIYQYIYISISIYIYISIYILYYAEHHPWTENPLLNQNLEWQMVGLTARMGLSNSGVSLTPVFSHGFSSFRLFSGIKRLPFFRTDPMLGQTRSVFDTENQIQILRYIFFRYLRFFFSWIYHYVPGPMDKIIGDVNGEIISNTGVNDKG